MPTPIKGKTRARKKAGPVKKASDKKPKQKTSSAKPQPKSSKLEVSNVRRKRAEEELKATNQQLRASEQQLKAANQQLKAANQQLQVSEQKLKKHRDHLEELVEERTVELKKSEERFSSLYNSSKDAIGWADPDGTLVDVNDAFAELTGYSRKELLVGKKYQEITPKEYEEFEAEKIEKIMKTGKPDEYEKEYIRKDGSRVPILLTVFLVKGAEGETIGVAGIIKDITERKRTEEELRIRNRLANIFLTIPDDQMYGEVLQVVLKAAESKYGIFGYIDEHGAFVCPSMTRDIWDECQVADKDIVFHRGTWGDSIWGRAIIEKKSLYSNEPFRVPGGHLPIYRASMVPIIHQGETIGLFEVANKETDYDEKDIQSLENIGNAIAPILNARLQRNIQEEKRKQAEEELKEKIKELEIFYDAAVDRELKMEEMRKKIANLERERASK